MSIIEAGADDFSWNEEILEVYTKIDELEKVRKELEEKNIKVDSIFLAWVPKELMAVDEKTKELCQKLFETLDENDAVQEIYSNLK